MVSGRRALRDALWLLPLPLTLAGTTLLYSTLLAVLYLALLLLFFVLLLLKDASRAAQALPQNQDVRVRISSGVLERRVRER